MKLVEQVESHLESVYKFSNEVKVSDFLISEEELLELAPDYQGKEFPKELFLVKAKPSEDLLEIALYLDETLKKNLETFCPSEGLHTKNISDFCALIEGVSHFVYYVCKANQNRNVTQLELELQAEVDKYVLLSLFLQAQSLDKKQILKLLFENYNLFQNLNQEQQDRYHTASDLARKYCYQLSQNLANREYDSFLGDVRSFYSLSHDQKVKYILAMTS